MIIIQTLIIISLYCSNAVASKNNELQIALSETELSALMVQVVSSKNFSEYKDARGFSNLKATLKSMSIYPITPKDSVNSPKTIGAPIYQYQVSVTYRINAQSTCTIEMPFVSEKGKLMIGAGRSEGGCGE